MEKPYLIYYNNSSGSFTCWDSRTKKITEVVQLPKASDVSHFYLLNSFGYDASHEGLSQCVDDFHVYCAELKSNPVLNIVYTKYFNDSGAVTFTLKRLTKHFDTCAPVDEIENKWINKCYNAGLMYCGKDPVVKETSSYDFSLQFPTIMASEDLIISKGTGREATIYELPKRKDLDYGYYHVKITSNHKDINKVFAFSKYDVYNEVSLKFAMKHKKKFDISIELIQDDEPNAYLYDGNDMITGKEIFGHWLDTMLKLRKLFSKNKLVKHLASSLCGHLSERNHINVSPADIDNYDVGLTDEALYTIYKHVYKSNGDDYYVLQSNTSPYKLGGLARVKSYVAALSRNQIAKVAMQDLDNVLRIQTDCVSFGTKQDFNIEGLKYEKKSSGLIYWKNVNRYAKIEKDDDGYHFISKKDGSKHYIDDIKDMESVNVSYCNSLSKPPHLL